MSDDTKEEKTYVMITLDDYRALIRWLQEVGFTVWAAKEVLHTLESPPELDPDKVH